MHKHHIIPRHEWKVRFGNLQGFNAPDNVVYLTIDQHSQAHQLLYEINKNIFDKIASECLSGQINKTEAQELARLQRVNEYFSDPIKKSEFKQKLRGRIPWNKGLSGIRSYIRTPETIRKLKISRSMQSPPTLGMKHTKESKDKMRSIALDKNAVERFKKVKE